MYLRLATHIGSSSHDRRMLRALPISRPGFGPSVVKVKVYRLSRLAEVGKASKDAPRPYGGPDSSGPWMGTLGHCLLFTAAAASVPVSKGAK